MLEEMLTNWQMRPTVVPSGTSALSLLQRASAAGQPFPLMLLDAVMPGMDGFELAELIKHQPQFGGMRIMMLVSAGQRGDAARCRELGIAAYLTKPIKQSDLLDAILTMTSPRKRLESRPSLLTRHSLREERHLRILLAEDNLVNQKLALRLLEKQGHEVAVAGNGLEALAALERQTFDLVLMDVQMPKMSGLEATAAIRQREQVTGAHLPIIALTANAMKGDRENCLAAGMDDYIPKPIQFAELFSAIERVLPPLALGSQTSEEKMRGSAISEPALPPEEPVFDCTSALACMDGDAELLAEIAGLFVTDSSRLLSEIRAAIARQDHHDLERAAHALKGATANFAAQPAVDAALKLEQMGRAGDLAQVEEAFAALEAEIARLVPSLVALVEEKK
jgi:CheY-like chemotaxis protein/HPt (histidine-containing phosphotransfer) domain-containing protein